VVMRKRPLKPDEQELLEETKDYVVCPVLVPTMPQAVTETTDDSALPEQGTTGGSSASGVGSPADHTKKHPTEDSFGGKSKKSRRGRFAGALKSKLLSPTTQPMVTRADDPDVTTLAPPRGKLEFRTLPYVHFIFLFALVFSLCFILFTYSTKIILSETPPVIPNPDSQIPEEPRNVIDL
jgi:hypothetical protein